METQKDLSGSGVSKDYLIAFGSLDNYLQRVENDEPPRLQFLAKRAFIQRSIKKYDEFFNGVGKDELITDKNREAIERLNSIVDQLNKIREDPNIKVDELIVLWKEVNEIIN
tara:strand:+ start:466 stop:801 length:336 start_codon:yes stop_codon:yes gene_type:complete